MKKVIFSLGGSIVVPEDINVDFLKQFKKVVKKYINNNVFYFIVGGGSVCRKYQNALRALKIKDDNILDQMGIMVTHLNANLLNVLFSDFTDKKIIVDPNCLPKEGKQLYFGGGWKPGWSTDYVSVMVAKQLGVKTVINLSNIDYAYDKDPCKYKDALPLENVSWLEFRALVGNKWVPGVNLPFDPIACELAEKQGISVIIMNGLNLSNLDNYLHGKKFIGTKIG